MLEMEGSSVSPGPGILLTRKQPKLYNQEKKLIFVTLIRKTHSFFLHHNVLY